MQDIRWKQRFQNFDKAFTLLHSALEERSPDTYSDLEQEGLIQRFEYTYELAWKTIKDYLEAQGVVIDPVTPRSVIKEAFATGIIINGQIWIDMLLSRNSLSHTYDFSRFKIVLNEVAGKYLPEMAMLHTWLLKKR